MSIGRAFTALLTLSLTVVAPSHVVAQTPTLTLQMRNGHVTLEARGVSVRRIIDEWIRLGEVTIINAEALSTTPTTILLTDVPERTALETILRDAPGYILGPRRGSTTPTEIDRIVIVSRGIPSGTAAAAGVSARSVPAPVPPDDNAAGSVLILGAQRRTDSEIARSAGTAPAQGPRLDSEGREDATDVEVASSATRRVPVAERPPTPIQPPPRSVAARNPFGAAPGSSTPGVISPVGPPPGFAYPPVTNPDVSPAP